MKHILQIIFLLLGSLVLLYCSDNGKKDVVITENKNVELQTVKDSAIVKEVVLITDKADSNFTDEKGRKQGLWIEYYKSGLIKKKQNYKDNLLDGKSIYYRFGNRNMWFEDNYENGKKEGCCKLYSLKISELPKSIMYFEKGEKKWMMFPSAGLDYSIKHGRLIKGIHIHEDSTYVIAPHENGNTWYEGLFVKTKLSDKKMVGVHKIYYRNGKLSWRIDSVSKIHLSEKGDTLLKEIF